MGKFVIFLFSSKCCDVEIDQIIFNNVYAIRNVTFGKCQESPSQTTSMRSSAEN